MFLKFFGLTSKPFELTPNPEFLFLRAASAGVVAVAVVGAGATSPSGHSRAPHAAPATLVAAIRGVVRWVTPWEGS
jgi:hypothetical protein